MVTDNSKSNPYSAFIVNQDYYLQRQEELLQLLRECLPYIKGGHWPPQNHHAPELATRMEKQLGI